MRWFRYVNLITPAALTMFVAAPSAAASPKINIGLDAGFANVANAFDAKVTRSGLEEVRGARLLTDIRTTDDADDALVPFGKAFLEVMATDQWGLRLDYGITQESDGKRVESLQFSNGDTAEVSGKIKKQFSFISLSVTRKWQFSETFALSAGVGVARAETDVEVATSGPLSLEITNGAVRNLALAENPGAEEFRDSTLYSPAVNADLLLRGTNFLSYGFSLSVVEFENGVSGFLGGGLRVQF